MKVWNPHCDAGNMLDCARMNATAPSNTCVIHMAVKMHDMYRCRQSTAAGLPASTALAHGGSSSRTTRPGMEWRSAPSTASSNMVEQLRSNGLDKCSADTKAIAAGRHNSCTGTQGPTPDTRTHHGVDKLKA